MKNKTIYVISDSVGETAEAVARATASQFDQETFEIIRIPYINTKKQIDDVIRDAAKGNFVICHTLVSEELRVYFCARAEEMRVTAVDILGPMLAAIGILAETKPRMAPGMVHRLDQDYFKKVEAIEFAVKYDDGKNPKGFEKADVVIIGVSRTSKTPLSMYLAYKGVKVANLPLVPEVPVAEELFQISNKRVVGLVIDPYKLNSIRTERLRAMGLTGDANYADVNRIEEELTYAKGIMRRIHCPVLDVTNKSIEETAASVIQIIERNKQFEEH